MDNVPLYCSVESAPNGHTRPQTRIDELENHAQQLLNNPSPISIAARYDSLRDDAHARYERLGEYERLQARALEARAVWDVGRAVFERLADRKLFKQVTTPLRNGDSLVDGPLIPSELGAQSEGSTEREQALTSFLSVGSAWLSQARQAALRDILNAPDHPYRHLLIKMRVAQLAVSKACRIWNDEVERRGKPRPIRRPQKSLSGALRESSGASMSSVARLIVTAGASHCLQSRRHPRTAETLAANALANIEYFGRFASTNVEVTLLGSEISSAYAAAETESDILAACSPYLDNTGKIRRQLGIREGPRRRSAMGHCPANFELYDEDPADQEEAEALFTSAGVELPRVMRAKDGAYRGSSVVWALAASIAKSTIYTAWPDT